MLLCHVGGVGCNAIIEHSKFCVEGTRCSAIPHAARGQWLCVCVVSGVIAESLLFLLATVNNSKQWQPRWSSCICSWSSSILKNKCLYCKCWSAGDREEVCKGGLYDRLRLGMGEFTTLVHPMRDLDEQMHFRYFRMSTGWFDELLRCIQPIRPEKATAWNIYAHMYTVRAELLARLWSLGKIVPCMYKL